MAVSNRVIKEHPLYINMQANLEEACEHIRYLTDTCQQESEELRYLQDYIRYRGLEEEFRYFKEHAHLDENNDLPFHSYVL